MADLNGGNPILLSESFGTTPDQEYPYSPFAENFSSSTLDKSWYQLRTPYTENFRISTRPDYDAASGNCSLASVSALTFGPNVFGLSDRDVPAAILRKQKSLNMTFSAILLPTTVGSLGYLQTVGISSYLSEFQHQDIGIRGCANTTRLCFYSTLLMNGTSLTTEVPLNNPNIPNNTTLYIRATPLIYYLGYSLSHESITWLAFAPTNFFVFKGASFALFASGNGNPWPVDAPDVGFEQVHKIYFDEDIPDYNI